MKTGKEKILIVKLGYSETLIPEIRRTCSLGDVFRSTTVLHLFKDCHVTWLTDYAAIPLLRGNPHIHNLLGFDLVSVLQLESERFDKVINLEKVPGICAMVNRIHAWSHFGFRFDEASGTAKAYEQAHEALAAASRAEVKSLKGRCWAQLIYQMLGREWKGEGYILGYQPSSAVQHDLGFNTQVGDLIPVKAWPAEHWQRLEELARGKYTVSRQPPPGSLEQYMEWIHSCRMLVTNDSLGLFLGVAMGRKVLGLFGPTAASEVAPRENLRTLEPENFADCRPCLRPACERGDPCIRHIAPETVFRAIQDWGPG